MDVQDPTPTPRRCSLRRRSHGVPVEAWRRAGRRRQRPNDSSRCASRHDRSDFLNPGDRVSDSREIPELLSAEQIQPILKLRSRRAARDLMVREMEHIFVGRTPMTTPEWLAAWVEAQRRTPRLTSAREATTTTPTPQRSGRSSSRRYRSELPPPRSRVKVG